jgi:hypothetical protein
MTTIEKAPDADLVWRQKIVPGAPVPPPVQSVFGRVGHVVAVLNDYVASLVGNDSGVPGATVKDALNALIGAIAVGLPFSPSRTLFVAKAWPLGVDPLIYFTNINDALIQANTLAPTATAFVGIVIFPGVYPENLTLVSNVLLFGMGREGVRPQGNMTWTPGAGINAARAAVREEVGLYNLRWPSASTFTDNRSAKTAESSILDVRDCILPAWTFTPRNNSNDSINLNTSIVNNFTGAGGGVAGGGVITTNATEFNGSILSFPPGCNAALVGGNVFATTMVMPNNTNNFTGKALDIVGNVNQFGTALYIGSYLRGSLTVSPGGFADVMTSECANLVAGSGPIDRRISRRTTGVTVAGVPLAIVLDPPLSDNLYAVSFSQVSGTRNIPLITAKATTGFTLTDNVGGNVYDLTVSKD